jgi:hypothetical protein
MTIDLLKMTAGFRQANPENFSLKRVQPTNLRELTVTFVHL